MPTVYRAMTPADDGFPQTGDTNRTLGVREGEDVTPDEEGSVGPGGGMSVATEVRYLPPWRVKRDPPWSFDTEGLPQHLQYTQDDRRHGVIEPTVTMPLQDLQELLAETREDWTLV